MMKAVGIRASLPIDNKDSLIDFETPIPTPGERDLLVKIEAISVNPVDFKIRQNVAKDAALDPPRILGWDAVGVVQQAGGKVILFKPGDRVFYAGDLNRPGVNAQYHLVDERIAGHAPKCLSAAEAAAMPLTTLTAWEILFDRLHIDAARDRGKSILIIGGAGGVGSVTIQVAKKIASLVTLATASRPETQAWCKQLGADHVVDHRDIMQAVRNAGFQHVDYILDFADTGVYWDAMAELIKPQGHIGSITGAAQPVALNKLKNKSVSFSWEFMYTRSMFQTEDMIRQHHILNQAADLLDKGVIATTLHNVIQGLSAETLKKAHALLESGKAIGKIAITY